MGVSVPQRVCAVLLEFAPAEDEARRAAALGSEESTMTGITTLRIGDGPVLRAVGGSPGPAWDRPLALPVLTRT